MYCNDNQDNASIESTIEAVRDGGIDVLTGLQAKLKHLKERLHRTGNKISRVSDFSENLPLHTQQATGVAKELTRAEKLSVCGNFFHMAQGIKICLTVEQQVAIAHWVIQTLQNPSFESTNLKYAHRQSEGKAECHESDVHGLDGDSGDGFGNEACQQDGVGNRTSDSKGSGVLECGHRTGNAESMDQACVEKPLGSLGAGTEGIISEEVEPIEVPQAADGPESEYPTQEDLGTFTLLDICIALDKDDLDERRM